MADRGKHPGAGFGADLDKREIARIVVAQQRATGGGDEFAKNRSAGARREKIGVRRLPPSLARTAVVTDFGMIVGQRHEVGKCHCPVAIGLAAKHGDKFRRSGCGDWSR